MCIQVVRDRRLAPVTAREIAEPLHESVRIALYEYVQPQDLLGRGVRARDHFLALHANRSLVRASDGYVRRGRFPPGTA